MRRTRTAVCLAMMLAAVTIGPGDPGEATASNKQATSARAADAPGPGAVKLASPGIRLRIPRGRTRRAKSSVRKPGKLTGLRAHVAARLPARLRGAYGQLVAEAADLAAIVDSLEVEKTHAIEASEREIFAHEAPLPAGQRRDQRSQRERDLFLYTGEEAVEVRTKQRFTRNLRRMHRASKWSVKIAEREVQLYQELAVLINAFEQTSAAAGKDPSKKSRLYLGQLGKRLRKAERDIAELADDREALMSSAELNWSLGVEKQIPPAIRSMLQRRVPSLVKRSGPGTDALPARSNRYRRKGGLKKYARLSAADIYRGRWYQKKQVLPRADRVLAMGGDRDADADGMHPAAFVIDRVTGLAYKLKFTGTADELHDSAATTTRLLDSLGYRTDPIQHYGGTDDDDNSGLLVAPGVIYSAAHTQNRVGLRVPRIARRMGIPPAEVGLAVHPVWDQVAAVKLVDEHGGEIIRGDRARQLVKKARKDLRLRRTFEYVRVKNVNLLDKNDSWKSIGPWDPSAPQHVGKREVRALSIIMDTWLGGNDVRVPNLRTDAREMKGRVEVVHKVSDTGSTLRTGNPNTLDWEPTIRRDRGVEHEDNGTIVHAEFDRTTRADAAWAVGLIANLSRAQIKAAVLAGASAAPIADLYVEKLISRRNALLAEFGDLVGVDKKGRRIYRLAGHKQTFVEKRADRNLSSAGGRTVKLGKGKNKVRVELSSGRRLIDRKGEPAPVLVEPEVVSGVLYYRAVETGKRLEL